VEALSCRLIVDSAAAGAWNMAADELLVRQAAEQGRAALRLYGWRPATLSLGYFQPATVRASDPRLARLPWVRRPSGGATLVHDRELTYALAVPPEAAWRSAEPWMDRMHRIIAQALSGLGLAGKIERVSGPAVKHGEVLCFQQYTGGDLLCGGKKVVGSAQRKFHQALLQHGAILLAQSEHTPALPGLRELIGIELTPSQLGATLTRALAKDTTWRLEPAPWTCAEETIIRQLAIDKYSSAAWNERR
jgi:lipoate-protein ligase A